MDISKKLMSLLTIMVPVLLFTTPSSAKMRTLNKIRAGIPPYTVLKSVLSANDTSMAAGIIGKESQSTPYLTWLSESDERIVSTMIASPKNQIYAVRNFGNQLELDSGAIDYGVRHLLTPVLLITSSSDNRAVQLFMNGYQDVSPAIRSELDHLHLALHTDRKELEQKERLVRNVEANVDYQVDMAIARYQERVRGGRLVVVGSILDFNDTYKHGAGRLIIININGERNSEKLRTMQLAKPIGLKAIKTNVGRDRPKPAKAAAKKSTKTKKNETKNR